MILLYVQSLLGGGSSYFYMYPLLIIISSSLLHMTIMLLLWWHCTTLSFEQCFLTVPSTPKFLLLLWLMIFLPTFFQKYNLCLFKYVLIRSLYQYVQFKNSYSLSQCIQLINSILFLVSTPAKLFAVFVAFVVNCIDKLSIIMYMLGVSGAVKW